ncbi:Oidioi.mRNA.OKI2018_I69.PAR.g13081.t1.cds [Oikopleura dioica]|uniref:Oidioi.mRNA.OKI2018_I69.PAR.g13081.t1.cds n=1 Tax=Oikopleura dioica TaxID=34765 RepID=A0ABN7S337_OIKDI|nr:Oidioi.mRNA.OKI2018_I69.PAR.g13081.t1.cds [Oikopleura dioica]
MSGRRIRKQHTGRRDVDIKTIREYCRVIKAGRSKEVYALYKKKFNGDTLSSSTLATWKKNMDKYLNCDKKKGCRPSYKQEEIKEIFDSELFKKIEELDYDLEGYVGLKEMAEKLAATDQYKDEPCIQSMTFSFSYCERIVKKYNMMVTTSTKMRMWKGSQSTRKIKHEGGEVLCKVFDEAVVYSNARGWMTRKIFQEEIKRFSRHLSRTKPGTKNLLLLDNFSGHLIDPVALSVHNVHVEYFKPGCTGQYQPLDMLFFAALKNQYRIFLRKFRQGQQKSSPGLELSVKTVARLGSEMKPGIVRACWRKTGLTRFAQLQGETIDNEEEEMNRHSIEKIEEELAQLQLQDDDEDDDVEVEEIAEQPWFFTYCGGTHRYYGKHFGRHFKASFLGPTSKSKLPKKSDSQPSAASFAMKKYIPTLSDTDVENIRKCQARLVSKECVPLRRFMMSEMQDLFREIVRAVAPENTHEDIIDNIVSKISTHRDTLKQCAEADAKDLEKMIASKAERIARSGSACLMVDHQSLKNKGSDTQNKRLGLILCITDEFLNVYKSLLTYLPIGSSAMEANLEPVKSILAKYGILEYVEKGLICIVADFAAQNLCRALTWNHNGCCAHSTMNLLNRTFTLFLSEKSSDEFLKAKNIFLIADQKHDNITSAQYPTLNSYLRRTAISEEARRKQVELNYELDYEADKDENGELDEDDDISQRYQYYPSLPKDF